MSKKYLKRVCEYLIIGICYSTLLITTSCSNQSGKYSMDDPFAQSGSSRQSDHSEMNSFPCFMPDEDCVSVIINWINMAKSSIIVQAYSFSSQEIARALINAKKRGVKIEVLMNMEKITNEHTQSVIQKLMDNHITIKPDRELAIVHNKVMIIDDENVITGSYNWTDISYYHDSDVVMFIRDECVNRKYKDNYDYNVQTNINSRGIKRSLCGEPCSSLLFNHLNPLLFSHPDRPSDDGFTKFTKKSTRKKEKSQNFVEIDVCFPGYDTQSCIKLISECIQNAKKSIFIQACSLTHNLILQSLLDASRRKKVDIKLLVDQKAFDDTNQKVSDLIKGGIEVKCDTTCHPGIAHSKTIIIDDDLVLTGSLNLTYNAQNKNRENLLRMKNINVNKMFKKNFSTKWYQNQQVDNSTCVVS